MWCSVGITVTLRMVNSTINLSIEEGRRNELNTGFVLREVDVLTFPGSTPMIKSSKDRDQSESNSYEIDIWSVKQHRRIIGTVTGNMRKAAHGC